MITWDQVSEHLSSVELSQSAWNQICKFQKLYKFLHSAFAQSKMHNSPEAILIRDISHRDYRRIVIIGEAIFPNDRAIGESLLESEVLVTQRVLRVVVAEHVRRSDVLCTYSFEI